MLEDSRPFSRARTLLWCSGFLCLGTSGLLLLVGNVANEKLPQICSFDSEIPATVRSSEFENRIQASAPRAENSSIQPAAFEQPYEPRVAGLISLDKDEIKRKYWAFPSGDPTTDRENLQLMRLPEVENFPPESEEPLAKLLAPQTVQPQQIMTVPVAEQSPKTEDSGPWLADPQPEVTSNQQSPNFVAVQEELAEEFDEEFPSMTDPADSSNFNQTKSNFHELSMEEPESGAPAETLSPEERQLLNAVIREASHAATGVPTNSQLQEQARTKIREAYALANRRAHYAARQELIEVLRMVSQARDAQLGHSQRTLALAAGLRALEEAEDFAPKGTQLEAELNLDVLTAAHRTPISKQLNTSQILPQQMMTLYYRYAQLKLALAVAGEPSGSMALHTLGKIHSQLGKLQPERHRQARRRAVAFQQAALLAHQQNHLAAHELGVLLADSGHLAEAEQLFLHVASKEPNSIVYRNLAKVQTDLGNSRQAAVSRDQANRLALQGATGRRQTQWISPQEFARIGNTNPGAGRFAQNPQVINQVQQPVSPAPQTMSRPLPGWR